MCAHGIFRIQTNSLFSVNFHVEPLLLKESLRLLDRFQLNLDQIITNPM